MSLSHVQWASYIERPLINENPAPITGLIPSFTAADPLKSPALKLHPFLSSLTQDVHFQKRLEAQNDPELWPVHRQLYWDMTAFLTDDMKTEIRQWVKSLEVLDLFIRFCSSTFKKNKFFKDWPDRIHQTGVIEDFDTHEEDLMGFSLAYFTLYEQRHQLPPRPSSPTDLHSDGFDAFLDHIRWSGDREAFLKALEI